MKKILFCLMTFVLACPLCSWADYADGRDTAAEAQGPDAVYSAVSSVPKLFWFDCGPANDCTKASIYYADPAAATPVRTLFDSNVIVLKDDILDGHTFTSASVNLSTYNMANMKAAFIAYFKDGKIWKVNTTTLAKTQVSNESGINVWPYICDAKAMVNWNNIANSILYYSFTETGSCNTGLEKQKIVKLSMTPTTPPIDVKTIGNRPLDIMFDGRVFVRNGLQFKLCASNFSSCDLLVDPYVYAQYMGYDGTRILFWADYVLYSYDYSKNILTELALTGSDDMMNAIIDRDGYAYFFVQTRDADGFNYPISKVALTGGSATALATFKTATYLSGLRLESSASRIIYSYQDPSSKVRVAYSVAKNGGTPVLLSNAYVRGFVAGDYFIYETTAGTLAKVKVDGTGRVTKPNTQLIGASQGGSGDWYGRYDPATLRIITKGSDNVARSFLISDNIATATGTSLGAVPVNIGGISGTGFENDMLLEGRKYETEASFGSDIIYIDTASAASFKRLTNSNGTKRLLDFQDLFISQTLGKPQ